MPSSHKIRTSEQNHAAKAAVLELTDDEIKTMEELVAQIDFNVIRYWEKEMK